MACICIIICLSVFFKKNKIARPSIKSQHFQVKLPCLQRVGAAASQRKHVDQAGSRCGSKVGDPPRSRDGCQRVELDVGVQRLCQAFAGHHVPHPNRPVYPCGRGLHLSSITSHRNDARQHKVAEVACGWPQEHTDGVMECSNRRQGRARYTQSASSRVYKVNKNQKLRSWGSTGQLHVGCLQEARRGDALRVSLHVEHLFGLSGIPECDVATVAIKAVAACQH